MEYTMIKKSFLFMALVLFFTHIFAETVEIDVPEAVFTTQNGAVIPMIEGFDLDGTGEETILPVKKMVFGSEVVKVEVVKQHRIALEAPLKKGEVLYNLSSMRKVTPALSGKRILPTVSKFAFNRKPTFKRDRQVFSFDFYPIIPAGEKEVVKIDRIRVTTKGETLLPMTINTKNGKSLLILTTSYFLAESEEIINFIKAKKESGFKVSIATENDYDGGKLKGIERVKKIRKYLRSVYKNYDFLLIIADPTTSGDEVPMVVTRPDKAEEPDYELVPTDIFYAEVTEDMDSNGNGLCGERADEIEYEFEFIVGRIPIYGKNVKNADKILAKTISFIKEKPSVAEYRRRIFFPTTISYYENQDNQRVPKMDGAYVAEYLINNSLKEPFSTKTLVEKSGIDPSEFTEEEALNSESMLENMNKGYGIVFWQAHGMPTYSVRTIWLEDRNGNGVADTYSRYEMTSDTFVDNSLINKVKAVNPFVFQGSCLNGTIESTGSLAYTVLANTAVGVVGASQVSYGAIFSGYNLSSQDIFAYGAVFTDALIRNKIPAEVFFDTKERWSNGSVLLTIKLETNYLGDPSLKLNVKECGSDSDCDNSVFCDGKEICVNGFCETAENSLPCPDTGTECEENICDEASKSCSAATMPDGSFCGKPGNACIGGRQCISGKCTDVNLKDCSEFDSECSEGFCEPESGKCVKRSLNEGKSCSSGLICVKNEVCREGFCEGEDPDLPEAEECRKTECNESDGFISVSDTTKNWDPCTTSDGKEGYCDYGKCTPKKQQKKESSSSSSSGCALTVF